MLIAYNIFVITTKTILQPLGCLNLYEMQTNYSWLLQFMHITCVHPGSLHFKHLFNYSQHIIMDMVCLCLLLIQRRIFVSHYFCHVINDTKAGAMLASR